MTETTVLFILAAFGHALVVIVGIYIAINVRLVRLETMVMALWEWWQHQRRDG